MVTCKKLIYTLFEMLPLQMLMNFAIKFTIIVLKITVAMES